MFSGGRGVLAASVFYKYFDKPIERVVIAAANPIATFQNSDNARNFGIELEAGRQFGEHFFVNANYTFVDSKITLLPEQLGVQTSSERPLAGQSKNLFNVTGGVHARRLLDAAALQLLRRSHLGRRRQRGAGHHRAGPRLARPGVRRSAFAASSVRLTLENLTDSDYLFTQTLTTERDAAALQAGPDRRAVVRLQRVLRRAMTNHKEQTRNHAAVTHRTRARCSPRLCALVLGARTSADQAPPVNVPGIDKPVIVVTGEVDAAPRPGPARTTTCCAAPCSSATAAR